MNTIIDELIDENKILKIYEYKDPQNPRTLPVIGTIKSTICDETTTPFESIDLKEYIYFPLYYTNNTLSTTKPSDNEITFGYIFSNKNVLREQFKWKRLTTDRLESIKNILIKEVDMYNAFLEKKVYSYELYENNIKIKKYGPFYGNDYNKNGLFTSCDWKQNTDTNDDTINEQSYKCVDKIRGCNFI